MDCKEDSFIRITNKSAVIIFFFTLFTLVDKQVFLLTGIACWAPVVLGPLLAGQHWTKDLHCMPIKSSQPLLFHLL